MTAAPADILSATTRETPARTPSQTSPGFLIHRNYKFYKSEVWQSLLISQGWNQGVWAGVLSGDSREESNLRFIQVIGRIQFLVVKELMPCCQLGHSQLLNATHISWHAAPLHLQSQQWCVKSSTCFQSLNSVFFFFSLLLLLAGKDTLLLKGLCD